MLQSPDIIRNLNYDFYTLSEKVHDNRSLVSQSLERKSSSSRKKKKSTFIHLEAIYIQEVFSPYQSMSGVMCSEYDKDWIYLTISLGLPCRNVMISSAYH